MKTVQDAENLLVSVEVLVSAGQDGSSAAN